MSDETTYKGSYAGIGMMLKSPMMLAVVTGLAETVMETAQSIAPEGTEAEDDPHIGRYKEGFSIETGLNKKGTRVRATVRNTAPEAIDVEKGDSAQEGRHVLMRALSATRAGM